MLGEKVDDWPTDCLVDDWPMDCSALEAVARFGQPGGRHADGFYS